VKRSPVEKFARGLSQARTDSVRSASAQKIQARLAALANSFVDSEDARTKAAAIKDFVLDHLPELQDQLIENCLAHGIQIHHAADAAAANKIILDICRRFEPTGGTVVKAKSMATEEIHLNHHLEEAGFEPVETDLGEYVVQIDHDTPSHIVTPIIHKNRKEIAESFKREELGPYTEVPEELAMQARVKLREKFHKAKIGVSGVNFAIAESGRIVLIENEGNNRLSTTAPQVHIALMGIEKMLPRESDLPLFLQLLAGSATGQHLTTYTHLISGPRREDEIDGPREVHLVLLDNGRTKVLDGSYREILRCIRCGACLNVCPVYRQASGHAYGHVYSGPLGAVLAPALEGVEKFGHLAKASTLCGACEEVCPVKIPIPRMLLQLRDEATRAGAIKDPIQWGLYASGTTKPGLWRTGLSLLPMASKLAPHPMKSGWGEFRELPHREGRAFRDWWKDHESDGGENSGSLPHTNLGQLQQRPEGGGQGGGISEDQTSERNTNQTQPTAQLWLTFKTKLEALGGKLLTLEELQLQDKVVYSDTDTQDQIPKNLTATDDVWQADIGITLADFAIAETGSVVLSAGQGRARLASLTPPTHVVLVKEIVPTLADAIQQIGARTTVIVTGTSRTADIEGVLVRGVHGPKELVVVRL
jgi:L-lactate dehydrogenase complex protein LldF